MAQLVSASAMSAEGRGFKSHQCRDFLVSPPFHLHLAFQIILMAPIVRVVTNVDGWSTTKNIYGSHPIKNMS